MSPLDSPDGLAAGFADPVLDAQAVFRVVLDAMSRPGTVHPLSGTIAAPAPLDPATAAVALALLDLDTPVWLDVAARRPTVEEYLRFHCGAPVVGRSEAAAFAIIADGGALESFEGFAIGSAEYPDRSATLIVQVDQLSERGGRSLTGPGIRDSAVLSVIGPGPAFWRAVADNHVLFPQGVDLILTAGDRVAGLPRTTWVEG